MRIASAQYEAIMNRSLALNQAHIAELNQQLSSGDRITVPSDDPIGAVRMSRLNREESTLNQYRANIASVTTRLTKNETYLTSMVNDMQDASDLLVGVADGSNTSTDLNARVNSLTALRDSLLYTANTKDAEGNYLFSGTLTGTPSITYDATAAVGSRYSYTGNTDTQQVLVGNGVTQAANSDVSTLDTLLNQLDSTISALSAPGVSASDPTFQATVRGAMDSVSAAMSTFSSRIAVIGGSQNILSTLDSNHSNVSLSNQKALLDIGSADYASVATDLSGYTTALQATYSAYAKISKLSLFNVI